MTQVYKEIENVAALPRLFSSKLFADLIKFQSSPLFDSILNETKLPNYLPPSSTMQDLYTLAYKIMLKRYRNEYIYKNILAQKILLGKHSLNTSFMLSELRVANCKADSLIINGTSTVYEIKSEYDSHDRLLNQISAYMRAFDKIFVVASSKQSQLSALLTLLPESIGIYALSHEGCLSLIRDSQSHAENVDVAVIFDILRKSEYEQIIKKYYGYIPDVPNTYSYRECKKLFINIPVTMAHKLMVETLKSRGKALKDFITDVPICLKAYSLRSNLSAPQRDKFTDFLNNSIYSFYKNPVRR